MSEHPLMWLLVGVLLGGVGNAAIRRYATFKESKGIALAIRGEISAIIEIVLKRRYLQPLEKNLHQLSDPTHQLRAKDIFAPGISENYFPLFNFLANKIGLLADLSDTLASFYTKAKSLIEDIHNLEEMRQKIATGSVDIDRSPLPELTTELRDLFHDTLRIGIQAMENFKNFHERTWVLGIR